MKLVVLSCILAAATSSLIAPLGIASPLALNAGLWNSAPLGLSPLALNAGLVNNAPLLAASNYRGPLSLAPGQPANIIAADGRPLDTLAVNLDRSAHITAQAVDGSGLRLLKKRSISPLVAPLAVNRVAISSIVAPSTLVSPLGLTSPAVIPGSIVSGPIGYANAPLIGW